MSTCDFLTCNVVQKILHSCGVFFFFVKRGKNKVFEHYYFSAGITPLFYSGAAGGGETRVGKGCSWEDYCFVQGEKRKKKETFQIYCTESTARQRGQR